MYHHTEMHSPPVDRNDVVRIVSREFPGNFVAALKILDEILEFYDSRDYNRHARLQIQVLKLSHGNLSELQQNVDRAIRDYRDVSFAERDSDYQAWLDRA